MHQIMQNQPIINIGCMGSVSDGKSTLVEMLTGIKTQRHSHEKIRNITIKQGYGNMKIWENNITTDGNKNLDCELLNHISFVDCPGHQDLIQTMLASISIMNGAIIVIAVDQPLEKKPQLIQHLIAAKIGKLDKIIICLNKIDLVEKYTVLTRKDELNKLLDKYDIKPFTIIPTSFNKRIGLDYLILAIQKLFNPCDYINEKKLSEKPIFRISRTFDINKPGTLIQDIKGGVIGGALLQGKLKINDEIEIKPGIISKNDNTWIPVKTKIIEIKSENNNLEEIIPGGLIAILTDIDPFYCKNDNFIGNVVGLVNDLPQVYTNISVNINLITFTDYKWNPKNNDNVILQIGTSSCDAMITNCNKNNITFNLNKPVCINQGQHIIICKNIDRILRIVADTFYDIN